MKCKICEEETGDDDPICLKCGKIISDAELEQYYETLEASIEAV